MTTLNIVTKSARLVMRVSPQQKELIEQAAAYTGRTVSDFVVAHAEVAAKKVVDEYQRLHLDQEQSRVLVEALLKPKRPNKKLRSSMENHRKRVLSK